MIRKWGKLEGSYPAYIWHPLENWAHKHLGPYDTKFDIVLINAGQNGDQLMTNLLQQAVGQVIRPRRLSDI